jgi:hypothetical protein
VRRTPAKHGLAGTVMLVRKRSIHELQISLWGWHDMRRKSEAQTSAPCRCNIKGRCDHKSCCCHWADDPNRFSNEEYSGE